jgi:succinoglycan biosynthesis protein ExoV
MQLYYYKDKEGNFGDDLNPLIWNHFIPDLLDDDSDTLLVGIGTLLNHTLPPANKRVVFGSGYGYGKVPAIDHNWKFYCVRGPLTARKLGLPPELAITDPALLTAELITTQPVTPVHKAAFIPHHGSKTKGNWQTLCRHAGIHYIDPAGSPLDVVAQIRSAEIVVCEAMHGAIIADAFRVPWIPVKCYDHILDFKWHDWCESVGLAYTPQLLPGIYNIRHKHLPLKIVKSEAKHLLKAAGLLPKRWSAPIPRISTPHDEKNAIRRLRNVADEQAFLSADSTHRRLRAQLHEALEHLRRDHAKAA